MSNPFEEGKERNGEGGELISFVMATNPTCTSIRAHEHNKKMENTAIR